MTGGSAVGIQQVEARDAAKPPSMNKIVPMTKRYPTMSVVPKWEPWLRSEMIIAIIFLIKKEIFFNTWKKHFK